MKNNKTEPIPVMDYRQYRRARRLVHECCNYIDGNCIALDDGEECVCVQSISYSLLCRWYRSHLDNWKVTDRDLLEIAVKNTPRLFPGETIPMEDVLGDALQELPEEVRREFLRKVSMMILTNSRKTYGACSILYPGMLEQLAERIGGDYYMIPSSVHEFLLVPREREQDREELKKMIAEVNRTELPPEEVLSDHLYLYCSREREVRIV